MVQFVECMMEWINMDEQKEKMTELRDILDEIEENRAKGLEKGCSVNELDSYLEAIIEAKE